MPSRDKDQKTAGIQDVAIFPSRLARLEKSFMQKWQKKKWHCGKCQAVSEVAMIIGTSGQ